LAAAFAAKLALAARVHAQQPKERGQKIFSLHAPEVECIGKGKAHKPYEFGVKVSVATPIQRCKGGQFVAHVATLPGNPYDGHTLAKVVPEITRQIGVSLQRVIADAGYRGHNAPKGQGLSVFTSGQKRGVTDKIKRELRRRSAVEPVIGHLKSGHRMDRNHLKGRTGDAANALLAAIGYNFRLLIAWITLLWAFIQNPSSSDTKYPMRAPHSFGRDYGTTCFIQGLA
jgi:IS5 family transposase